MHERWSRTLWLCQNSYWKWPFIVCFPIKNGGFSIVMLVYQRVSVCPWQPGAIPWDRKCWSQLLMIFPLFFRKNHQEMLISSKNRHVHPMFHGTLWFDGHQGHPTGSNRDPTGIRALRHREVLRIHHHQTGGDDESLGGSENFCVGEWELLGNRRVSQATHWKIDQNGKSWILFKKI